MTIQTLNTNNIFILEHKGRQYLYAPLRGILALTDSKEIMDIEQKIALNSIPDNIADLMGGEMPQHSMMPEDLSEITILMNQKCNFACRYCYSANGRSRAELSPGLFDTITDWFVTHNRLSKCECDHLRITFSGGGDPMLSFENIKLLINKLRESASNQNIPLKIGLVCNGSLIKDADADFLANNIDDIVISFDVIEDVHNNQRSHYNIVAQTIKDLSEKHIIFGIRSTITRLNVNRMSEMVEIIHNQFKGCRSIAMEAVLSNDMWHSESDLREFYTAFVENYYPARRLGELSGINVGNTIDISAESLKLRACPGKVCITPNGFLTACSRVATEGDPFYKDFIFGMIKEGSIEIDYPKYDKIMSVKSNNIAECKSCFARYHCGGGCMLGRLIYSPAFLSEYCRFTRNMLIHSIIYDLD